MQPHCLIKVIDYLLITFILFFIDLLKSDIIACGTSLLNRRIPADLKATTLNKNMEAADLLGRVICYLCSGGVMRLWTLYQLYILRVRKYFIVSVVQKLQDEQQYLVRDYNKYMSGVDKSEHLICKYNTLRKTDTYWKTIFYPLLNIHNLDCHTNNCSRHNIGQHMI